MTITPPVPSGGFAGGGDRPNAPTHSTAPQKATASASKGSASRIIAVPPVRRPIGEEAPEFVDFIAGDGVGSVLGRGRPNKLATQAEQSCGQRQSR